VAWGAGDRTPSANDGERRIKQIFVHPLHLWRMQEYVRHEGPTHRCEHVLGKPETTINASK
jgi:hypothetical protein